MNNDTLRRHAAAALRTAEKLHKQTAVLSAALVDADSDACADMFLINEEARLAMITLRKLATPQPSVNQVRYTPEPGSESAKELAAWYDRKTFTGD